MQKSLRTPDLWLIQKIKITSHQLWGGYYKLQYPFQQHLKQNIKWRIWSGNDHEVEFHEIELQLFQEIEFLIMRSKLCLFMRSNLSNNIDQEVDTLIMRSKLCLFMRSNLSNNIDQEVDTSIRRLTLRSGGQNSKKHY